MVGADGQLAAAGALRTVARAHRARHRHAPGKVRAAVGRARTHCLAHRHHRRQRKSARQAAHYRRAQAVVLLGLPAQHVDQRAGRLARAGRHRLPLHDRVDGSPHRHLQPDGRRRRGVDRSDAVFGRPARVRQPRRRHVLPLGPAGDSCLHRGQGEHHLQDPLQRRRGHDGRPAGRRPAVGAADCRAGLRRRHVAHRHRHGRAGEVQRRHQAARRRNGAPP